MLELSKQVVPHFLVNVTSHGAADDVFTVNITARLNARITKETKNIAEFRECFEASILS
jgi:hypothetical protein